jgi:hypothetical protein
MLDLEVPIAARRETLGFGKDSRYVSGSKTVLY